LFSEAIALATATVLLEVLVLDFHTKEKPRTDFFLRSALTLLVVGIVKIIAFFVTWGFWHSNKKLWQSAENYIE
jgi:predicted acyltransferase